MIRGEFLVTFKLEFLMFLSYPYICMYIYIYVCVCVRVRVRVCVCLYTYIYIWNISCIKNVRYGYIY